MECSFLRTFASTPKESPKPLLFICNIFAEWRDRLLVPAKSSLARWEVSGEGGISGGIISGERPSFLPLTRPGLWPDRPLPPGERRFVSFR